MQNIGKALVAQRLAFYLWRMKQQLLFTFIVLIGINIAVSGQYAHLDKLVTKKDYHTLSRQLGGKKWPADITSLYSAVLNNATGAPDASNEQLKKIKDPSALKGDTLQYYYYKTLYDNHVQLFNYAEAADAGTYLVEHFPSFFKNDDLQSEKDALIIWKTFKQTPAQTVVQPDSTTILMKKDIAGLWNIPVTSGDSTYSFIFDSGAGLSTIAESYAKLLGLTIMEGATLPVAAGITGIPTQSKLAVAPELRIKDIVVRNCIFLVFPDSSLTFGGGAYKINGIIGFPVIREMHKLHFTGNELLVTKTGGPTEKKWLNNLAIDQLKPIVYLSYTGWDRLPFTLDFGASHTIFSDVFYKKYQKKLDKEGTPAKESYSGASGSKEFNILKVPMIKLFTNGTTIPIKDARVSKEVLHTNDDVYYGNIGQDVIRQFKRMVISFKDCYVYFE
jgi:hypothetical protein